MSYHDVQFPTDISWGSSGGPGFSTSIITVDSGHEYRVARWSQARRRYDVAESVKTTAELSALLNFYMCRQGCAHSFRFKDWSDYATTDTHTVHGPNGPTDYSVSHNDSQFGVGDGSTTQFQLKKRYADFAVVRTRNITKPIASTVKIGVNGVNQTSGWSVNDTTGIVTFTSAPADGAELTWGGEFDVPVRFGDEVDGGLPISLDAYESGSVSIPLIEVPDDTTAQEEFFMGGAKELALTANYSMDTVTRCWNVTSSSGSLKLILPNPASEAGLAAGGPYYFVALNSSSAANLLLCNFNGTTLVTLTPGTGVTVWLSIDAVGTRVWNAF